MSSAFAFPFGLDPAEGLRGRCSRMSGHRHGHGRGGPHHRGGPWGSRGPMGFGGPGRRRMRRGDTRAAILVLLAERPFNGYGLMQEVEDRSGGAWRPSPGSMYPALAQLEDEGLIAAEAADGAKQFSLTDAGRTYVSEHREQLGEPWAELAAEVGEGRLEMRSLIGQLAAAAMQVAATGTDDQVAKAGQILTDARKALYRLLAED